MRRNYRMILKWFILIGIVAILSKILFNGLVNLFFSSSTSVTGDTKDSSVTVSYEEFLIAWATTGQRSKSEKISMENVQTRNDLQLLGAQIIFRHGARTPLHFLPSLEQVCQPRESNRIPNDCS